MNCPMWERKYGRWFAATITVYDIGGLGGGGSVGGVGGSLGDKVRGCQECLRFIHPLEHIGWASTTANKGEKKSERVFSTVSTKD